jgi:hypothetical protein
VRGRGAEAGGRVDEAEVIGLCAEPLGSYMKAGKVVVRARRHCRRLREPYSAGHARRIAAS